MKDAFLRAARTAAQTLAGCLVALPTVDSVAGVRTIGEPLLVGIYVAFIAGVVSLLQNLAENASNSPKP